MQFLRRATSIVFLGSAWFWGAEAIGHETRAAAEGLPVIVVEGDDTLVDRSCRLVFGNEAIVDVNGDGVVHVRGTGHTIQCEGRLRGADTDVAPDAYAGVGIVLQGADHRLLAPAVSGFKVGILVDGADRVVIEDGDVSDNFRQRLGSTWEREDPADWLWPHANDEGEWLENYGAGLAVRRAVGVGIRRLWARDVQNGIVLEFAEEVAVVGCDCSFLSGWGCALWRTNRSRIVGNRFDYCIRGYSHGRYNRGQDSAGLLMFEQCCGNRVEANSITHGGDGVFAFAGKQALGEVAGPEGPDGTPFDCERKGCNGNVFALNDLSFAAAHGLELTFSFDNEIRRNVIESNAICGLWLGYSRDTRVAGNRFFDNGGAGYGAERGAINAEHAQRILVAHNLFEHNALDVRLWSDADVGPAATPWGRVNGQGATDNRITANRSEPTLRVELREVGDTIVDVDPASVDADAASRAGLRRPDWRDVRGLLPADGELWAWPLREDLAGVRGATLKGLGTAALSDREALGGRETIVIDEWGPYDWTRPYLQPLESGGALARYRLLGPPGTQLGPVVATGGAVVVSVRPASADGFAGPDGLAQAVIEVRPKAPGVPSTYDLKVQVVDPAGETEVHALGGVLMEVAWTARFASWERDPREDPAALFDALEGAPPIELTHLDLDFGGGGPASVVADPTPELEALGHDRFGTWATTTLTLPPGAWRLRTVSDDGLRVQLDGETVLEDWTWHGPTVHDHVFRISEQSEVQLDVRHFELDGWARLTVELEAVDA